MSKPTLPFIGVGVRLGVRMKRQASVNTLLNVNRWRSRIADKSKALLSTAERADCEIFATDDLSPSR